MLDVAVFALGSLTGLALWWLVLGPLFHGFMQGLMGLDDPARCPRWSPGRDAVDPSLDQGS